MSPSASDHLLRGMKNTAGSRFNAAKRLEHRDKALTRLAAFTSAFIITLTVLPYFLPLPKPIADLINLYTVSLAITILVASLYQYSNGDVVNAEQHHRSALEINELRRELEIHWDSLTVAKLEEITARYNGVLQKYSINHDDIDFAKMQFDRPEDFPWVGWLSRLWIWTRWQWNRSASTLILLALSVATVWIIADALQVWDLGIDGTSP